MRTLLGLLISIVFIIVGFIMFMNSHVFIGLAFLISTMFISNEARENESLSDIRRLGERVADDSSNHVDDRLAMRYLHNKVI